MKRALMLMGPNTGRVLDMSDADAPVAVADGWARDITALSEPFDSSGQLPMAKWPASLRAWLENAWGVPVPPVGLASDQSGGNTK